MHKPKIDWVQPGVTAAFLVCIFLTAYGGAWLESLFWVGLAWMDSYLTGETEIALPRKSYLVDPLPRLVRYR